MLLLACPLFRPITDDAKKRRGSAETRPRLTRLSTWPSHRELRSYLVTRVRDSAFAHPRGRHEPTTILGSGTSGVDPSARLRLRHSTRRASFRMTSGTELRDDSGRTKRGVRDPLLNRKGTRSGSPRRATTPGTRQDGDARVAGPMRGGTNQRRAFRRYLVLLVLLHEHPEPPRCSSQRAGAEKRASNEGTDFTGTSSALAPRLDVRRLHARSSWMKVSRRFWENGVDVAALRHPQHVQRRARRSTGTHLIVRLGSSYFFEVQSGRNVRFPVIFVRGLVDVGLVTFAVTRARAPADAVNMDIAGGEPFCGLQGALESQPRRRRQAPRASEGMPARVEATGAEMGSWQGFIIFVGTTGLPPVRGSRAFSRKL